MYQSSISNEKDISRKKFRLVLKMTLIHCFDYILFYICLKIMKLVFLETIVNKTLGEKGINQNRCQT